MDAQPSWPRAARPAPARPPGRWPRGSRAASLVVDALGAQLAGQRPPGQPAPGLLGPDEHARRRPRRRPGRRRSAGRAPPAATSSGQSRWRSLSSSCWRGCAAPASSWRSTIWRATSCGSGSPAGPQVLLGVRGMPSDRPDVAARAASRAPWPRRVGQSCGSEVDRHLGHGSRGRLVDLRPDAELLLDLLLDLVGEVGVVACRKVRAFSLPWPSWSPS